MAASWEFKKYEKSHLGKKKKGEKNVNFHRHKHYELGKIPNL